MANPNWVKGVSGNPGGMVKKNKPFLDMVKDEDIEAAYDVVMKVIRSGNKSAVSTAQWLLEMKFGRPKQQTELSGAGGETLKIEIVSPQQGILNGNINA